jgi:hypothetical protein
MALPFPAVKYLRARKHKEGGTRVIYDRTCHLHLTLSFHSLEQGKPLTKQRNILAKFHLHLELSASRQELSLEIGLHLFPIVA